MKKVRIIFYFLIFNLIIFFLSAPLVIFYGPFNSLKLFTIGAIHTSRHAEIAEYFLPKDQVLQIRREYNQKIMVEPVITNIGKRFEDRDNGILIEEISGRYFKGKVMLIQDPTQLRLAVTKELGTAGQRLSELVAENGAIAGINGGGFYDPNAQGNGAFPEGITVLDGQIIHNSLGMKRANIIGFNSKGRLILKELSVSQIESEDIQHAVSFLPNLILQGQPQISGDGGWGLAPRTGIGQKADGTVILVVIDGRIPGWSAGATLRDLMNVFIEYGAENAANLDGGSSTEMIYNGQIINRLWNVFGERYIPTAFIVMPR